MPFARPDLAELIDQGAAEFESRLPGVSARVRRSVVGVLNRVMAGALSALYKYSEWLNLQNWPDQAEGEFLDDHGARWGVLRNAASFATLTVRFSGVNGAVVPIDTSLQRVDGAQYSTTEEGTIGNGFVYITCTALLAGQRGSAAINSVLALSSPLTGITSTATAQTAAVGGADAEGDEPYRARILARIRKPPQGGCAADYVAWTKEVPGVTRAWVYPQEQGDGTVVVRFTRDDDSSPIPDIGEVAKVQAALDAARPVTSTVYAVAPVAKPLNLSIVLVPDTLPVRAAVTAELVALLNREGVPGGTILISHIREAISIASGETDHTVLIPSGDVPHAAGQLPVLGEITWA
ncbi:MAG: baseplate J/gp47 family protein [Polaromonas sp.]